MATGSKWNRHSNLILSDSQAQGLLTLLLTILGKVPRISVIKMERALKITWLNPSILQVPQVRGRKIKWPRSLSNMVAELRQSKFTD